MSATDSGFHYHRPAGSVRRDRHARSQHRGVSSIVVRCIFCLWARTRKNAIRVILLCTRAHSLRFLVCRTIRKMGEGWVIDIVFRGSMTMWGFLCMWVGFSLVSTFKFIL